MSEEVDAALRARFILLSLVHYLRMDEKLLREDAEWLAERLERIALGEEAEPQVFVPGDGRARQQSVTQLRNVFLTVLLDAERKKDPGAPKAEIAVAEKIGGLASLETVRQARRKLGLPDLPEMADEASAILLETARRAVSKKT